MPLRNKGRAGSGGTITINNVAVPVESSLPTSGNTEGRLVVVSGQLYIYTSSNWVALGGIPSFSIVTGKLALNQLPAVTATDNDKVLQVRGGDWSIIDSGTEPANQRDSFLTYIQKDRTDRTQITVADVTDTLLEDATKTDKVADDIYPIKFTMPHITDLFTLVGRIILLIPSDLDSPETIVLSGSTSSVNSGWQNIGEKTYNSVDYDIYATRNLQLLAAYSEAVISFVRF